MYTHTCTSVCTHLFIFNGLTVFSSLYVFVKCWFFWWINVIFNSWLCNTDLCILLLCTLLEWESYCHRLFKTLYEYRDVWVFIFGFLCLTLILTLASISVSIEGEKSRWNIVKCFDWSVVAWLLNCLIELYFYVFISTWLLAFVCYVGT